MATPYTILYNGLLNKLKSTGFPDLTEEDTFEMFSSYIRPAVTSFYACKQDLTDRNDEDGMFNVDLIDQEIEILINFMYAEYLNANFINVPSLLRQSLVSRDYHAFSNANHLGTLEKLRDRRLAENDRKVSVYSNLDSKLFEKLLTKRGTSEPDDYE